MFKKIFSILSIFLFLSSVSMSKDKIDETIDKTTDFLKSITKKSLNKSQTAEFLNNYAITLEDERNQGVVTYIFDENNYKRYTTPPTMETGPAVGKPSIGPWMCQTVLWIAGRPLTGTTSKGPSPMRMG